MSAPMPRMLGLVVLFTLCIAGRVSAELEKDAYERFYNRYVGTWKANVAKSRYIVGEAPKEGASHTYGAIRGRKGIKYNGSAIRLLDGKEHPVSETQSGRIIIRSTSSRLSPRSNRTGESRGEIRSCCHPMAGPGRSLSWISTSTAKVM